MQNNTSWNIFLRGFPVTTPRLSRHLTLCPVLHKTPFQRTNFTHAIALGEKHFRSTVCAPEAPGPDTFENSLDVRKDYSKSTLC